MAVVIDDLNKVRPLGDAAPDKVLGLLGASELGAPAAITGGIAEALIATAFGLGVAITALIPFNYLNARLEEARLDIQDAASHVELCLNKRAGNCAFQNLEEVEA